MLAVESVLRLPHLLLLTFPFFWGGGGELAGAKVFHSERIPTSSPSTLCSLILPC